MKMLRHTLLNKQQHKKIAKNCLKTTKVFNGYILEGKPVDFKNFLNECASGHICVINYEQKLKNQFLITKDEYGEIYLHGHMKNYGKPHTKEDAAKILSENNVMLLH